MDNKLSKEKLFQALSLDDFSERRKAIEILSNTYDVNLYKEVEELLNSEDSIIRNSAMELMVKWGIKIIPFIVERTKDLEENQRIYASNILGDIGNPQAVDALLALLPDEHSNVRFAAAEAIGKIGSKDATMSLLHYLDSKKDDFWEQFPLILALGQLKDERAVLPLLKLAENEMLQQPVLEAIAQIADEHAIPYILDVLKTEDVYLHNIALRAIKNLREKAKKYEIGETNLKLLIKNQFRQLDSEYIKNIVENLQERLSDDDIDIRLGVIYLLGLSDYPKAIDSLISNFDTSLMPDIEDSLLHLAEAYPISLLESLKLENLTCRDIIIRILAKLKIDTALDIFIEHLSNPISEVRVEAIIAMENFLFPEVIPHLINLFDDSSQDVQNTAVEVLKNFDKDIILPYLEQKMEEDKSSDVEFLIIKTLAGLQPKVDRNILLKFSSSESVDVRCMLARSLKSYTDEEAAETLLGFLSDPYSQVKEEAIRSLEDRGEDVTDCLITALKDNESWVRYFAAKALGKQKANPKIINSLAELLNDSIPFVQIAVLESLGNLNAKNFANTIESFVNNSDANISQAAINALSRFKLNPAKELEIEKLLEGQMENSNWIVRKAIAEALGELKTKNALDLLLIMLAQEAENIVDKEIILSLGKLPNHKEVIPILISFTSEKKFRDITLDVLVAFDKKVIPYLEKSLTKNNDTEMKKNLISILSRINDDKSIKILVNLASSEISANVRKQAILALKNFSHDQRAIWAIMWAVNNDSDELVRQVAKSLLIS